MFTQVVLAGYHDCQKNWVPSMLPHNLCLISMGMGKKWKLVDLKMSFFQIHQFSILKKLWDLAHENLEKMTQRARMWLNLYACQAVQKKTFFIARKAFFWTAWQPYSAGHASIYWKLTIGGFEKMTFIGCTSPHFFSSPLKSGTNFGVVWMEVIFFWLSWFPAKNNTCVNIYNTV